MQTHTTTALSINQSSSAVTFVVVSQGLQRCMGACLSAVGGDCYECFDPDDDPITGSKSEAAMLRCSYALDMGNAR
jgi:hypothetical protein